MLTAKSSYVKKGKSKSIHFVGVREAFAFHINYVCRHCLVHQIGHLGISADEARTELFIDPEHVMRDQHLAIHTWSGTNTAQATWQRVAVPFVYVAGSAGSRTPQYILVTMTGSSDNLAGTDGTILWVDEIKAVYNSTGISELEQIAAKPYFRNNSIITDLTGLDLTGASLQLFNINGQLIAEHPLNGNDMNVTATDAAAGIYIYRIISAQATSSGKIVKQ